MNLRRGLMQGLICAAGALFCIGATAEETPRQWRLPSGLVEISGLAAASPTSVFAHNDEHGIIYEIDIESGETARAFALGDPTVKADFEGIAIYDERVYLITSEGRLYEAEIGVHGERRRFNVYDTGVGGFCEVEGLARAEEPGAFLVLCKRAYKESLKGKLLIYRWSLGERRPVSAPFLAVPYKSFLTKDERKDYRPAGLEWDARSEEIVVISSHIPVLAFFNKEGALAKKRTLPAALHRQSEGIALIGGGNVVIADEGAKRGPGTISVYRAAQ